jgi:hypothetical protein
MAKKKPHSPIPIECPHLIICEGKADEALLKFLTNSIDKADMFQIHSAKGVKNITRQMLAALTVSTGFELLESLIIVRDADDKPDDAVKSVQRIFKDSGFSVPSTPCVTTISSDCNVACRNVKTAFALLPKPDSITECGSLENLCLETLKDSSEKSRILNISDEAIKKVGIENLKSPHKNKLYTYLSLTEYVEKSLATAIDSGAFDFSVPQLEPFKNLLLSVLTEKQNLADIISEIGKNTLS